MKGKNNILISMILLVFIALMVVNTSAINKTAIQGFVNDHANVISEEDEINIEKLLKELYDSNAAQIAILTIDTIGEESIEDYSLRLAHENIGDSKLDNGLLYLVIIKDRKYRIEVGYGLEDKITDALASRIGRKAAENYFSEEKYSKGILNVTEEIYKILKDDNYAESMRNVEEEYDSEKISKIIIIVFMLIIIFGFFNAMNKESQNRIDEENNNKNKNTKKHRGDDELLNAALIAALFFGRGGGGSGGFGGNLGGGFGGFGGGGFGGGGAGGRW